MANIALISKYSELKSEIEGYLLDANYAVIKYQDSNLDQEALASIDLILFDTAASPFEPTAFVSQLKTAHSSIPLIVVIDQAHVASVVQLMRAGAINVLVRPLNQAAFLTSIDEGIAQRNEIQRDQSVIQQVIDLLQSLSPRYATSPSATVQDNAEQLSPIHIKDENLDIGDLKINLKQGRAFYQKVPIELTYTQFRLLVSLAETRGHVVLFEELYFRLHGLKISRSAARTALSAHLSNLRTKLNEVGCGDYLENIRGRGYLLDLPEQFNSHVSKLMLDFVVEQLPVILWETDINLHLTSVVGAGLAAVNLKSKDLIGHAAAKLFQTENDHSFLLDRYQKALSGEATTFEMEFRGHSFYTYIGCAFGDDEQSIGIIGFALDVTEHKQTEV